MLETLPTEGRAVRPAASPYWPLVEDVEADDLVVENGGGLLTLSRDVVVDTPRRVVVCRMDARDIVSVEQI